MPKRHNKTVTDPNGIVWHFSKFRRGSKWCLVRRWNVRRCLVCRGAKYVNSQIVMKTMYQTPTGWQVRSSPIVPRPGVVVQDMPRPNITCSCLGVRGPRKLQARPAVRRDATRGVRIGKFPYSPR